MCSTGVSKGRDSDQAPSRTENGQEGAKTTWRPVWKQWSRVRLVKGGGHEDAEDKPRTACEGGTEWWGCPRGTRESEESRMTAGFLA